MSEKAHRNLTVSHDKVTNRRKVTNIHYHDEFELYYLINGNTKYFIGDEIFHLEKGNFILVPKGMFHKTDSEQCLHNERILVSFRDDIFDKSTYPIIKELSSCKFIYIPDNKLYKVEEILHKLELEYNKNAEHKELMLKLCTLELLTLLCRLKCEYNPQLNQSYKLMNTVSEYISTNYFDDLSLNSLSKKFAISKSHLSRKFKETSGIGLNEYITYVRILNAEKLLTQTDKSITEIAAICGFNDSNYFSSVFKKVKGVTPHRYSTRTNMRTS